MLLAVSLLFAQPEAWTAFTYNETVTCVASDAEYHWAGTTNGVVGLNRSSGELVYLNLVNAGLGHSRINCLLAADDGVLWIGSPYGLFKREDGNVEQISFAGHGLLQWGVSCIAEADDGTIWFGLGMRLGRLAGTDLTFFSSPTIPSGSISFIEAGSSNGIWFASNYYQSEEEYSYSSVNLVQYANGVFTPYLLYSGPGARAIRSMATSGSDSLWIYYTESPNLRKYVKGVMTDTIAVDDLGLVLTGDPHLAVSGAGELWISFTSTLIKWAVPEPIVYQNPSPGLTDVWINAIRFDAQGTLLIGTAGKGISTFEDGLFEQQLLSNSPLSESVPHCVNVSPDDRLWISDGNRLLSYQAGNWRAMPYPWGDGQFGYFDFDPAGNLWAYNGGYGGILLMRFDGENWSTWNPADHGVTDFHGYRLVCDSAGNVWLGGMEYYFGYGGLVRFDGQNFHHFTQDNSPLNSNFITAFEEDNEGRMLVATGLGNLFRISGNSMEILSGQAPGGDYILDIAVKSDGEIWTTWHDGGLANLSGGGWVEVIPPPELFYYDPINLEFDAQDRLWVITRNNKLMKLEAGEITEYPTLGCYYVWTPRNLVFMDNGDLFINPAIDGCLLLFSPAEVASEDPAAVPELIPRPVNHPNPFRTGTTIRYRIPESGPVEISIYDLRGRQIATYDLGTRPAGELDIAIDAGDAELSGCPAGIYIYRINCGGREQTGRMVIVK